LGLNREGKNVRFLTENWPYLKNDKNTVKATINLLITNRKWQTPCQVKCKILTWMTLEAVTRYCG